MVDSPASEVREDGTVDARCPAAHVCDLSHDRFRESRPDSPIYPYEGKAGHPFSTILSRSAEEGCVGVLEDHAVDHRPVWILTESSGYRTRSPKRQKTEPDFSVTREFRNAIVSSSLAGLLLPLRHESRDSTETPMRHAVSWPGRKRPMFG